MRKKATALIFAKANVNAETLNAFHAPGMKEALLSAGTFRVALAEPGTGKTNPIWDVDDSAVFFGNRLSVVVVGETGAGKTAFMSRLVSAHHKGGSGEQLPD